jgi:hypothetical protein
MTSCCADLTMSQDPYAAYAAPPSTETGAGKEEKIAVLAAAYGVAVVQKSNWGNAFGDLVGYNFPPGRNVYKVSVLPPGIKVSALRFLQ